MKKHLTLTLALVVACLVGTSVFGATINVPSANYPTIQAGIDAANDGDTALVADGTYTGAGNKYLNLRGKKITVKSENGPQNCIIDGEGDGTGFYFNNFEGPFSVVEGFTIKNFNKSGILLRKAHPKINNCIIIRNSCEGDSNAPDGAGISCLAAAPTITNCTIRYNFGARSGGGIYASASPTILNCDVSFNEASTGGGMSLYNSQSVVVNCTVTGNASINPGGGVHADEYSGGMGPSVTNSIIWNNSPNNVHVDRGYAFFTYCDIQNGWEGEGNIDADPLFLDPDLHLTGVSPCINMGNNNARLLPATDKDGLPRIIAGTVDIGAYEFHSGPVYPAVSGWIELKGVPIDGAEVQLKQKRQDTQTAVTDGNGSYQFENVITGKPFDILIKKLDVAE